MSYIYTYINTYTLVELKVEHDLVARVRVVAEPAGDAVSVHLWLKYTCFNVRSHAAGRRRGESGSNTTAPGQTKYSKEFYLHLSTQKRTARRC